MTEGSRPRRSQTGTARRASKNEHRRRERQQLDDPRPLMSVATAAEYLDVSRWTVYRLIATGQLKHVVVGETIKVLPADIDDYLGRAS